MVCIFIIHLWGVNLKWFAIFSWFYAGCGFYNRLRIYYCKGGYGGKIYTVKIDGTDKIKLNDDASSYVTVVGDQIFYLKFGNNDQSFLFSMKTDGSRRQQLSEDTFNKHRGFSVSGDYVYYTHVELSDICHHQSLYSMKTDGSEKRLIEDGADDFDVSGDRIFFRGGTLFFSMKTDGSDKRKLNDDNVCDIHVVGDKIYYRLAAGGKLYSINTNGSNRQKLDDDFVQNVCIVGDWIYFVNNNAHGEIYRMKLDGSDKHQVTI